MSTGPLRPGQLNPPIGDDEPVTNRASRMSYSSPLSTYLKEAKEVAICADRFRRLLNTWVRERALVRVARLTLA